MGALRSPESKAAMCGLVDANDHGFGINSGINA
jgi:hypothetical protein